MLNRCQTPWKYPYLIDVLEIKERGKKPVPKPFSIRMLAGETGIEPATNGFGDFCFGSYML